MKEFAKKDLKNYMRVVLNNGDIGLVVEDTIRNISLGAYAYKYLDFYSDDLKYLDSKSYEKERLDIVAVYPPKIQDKICIEGDDVPIWYKKAVKEFSQDELVILRNLDNEYEYIARDRNNGLYLFTLSPSKGFKMWGCAGDNHNFKCFKHIFQQIKWEDEEPVRIDDYVERS